MHVRPFGRGDQLGDGLVEKSFEPDIVIRAVIGSQNALVLALGGTRQLLLLLLRLRRFPRQRRRRRTNRKQ